jgi:SAM-dependent methyltransferase
MSLMAEAVAKEIARAVEPAPLLKLNLGAGKSRMEGYLSVDSIPFEGLDVVANLNDPWPWGDNTVSDIHMSHVLEHFTGDERVHIFNEMYRVLIPGGKAAIITPHWASQRAYGDFTHKWPPVSEFLYYYVWREWRIANAPHCDIEFNPKGYSCDFNFAGGYSLHAEILPWNIERQQYAQKWYKEACSDTHMTITSQKKPA